MNDSRQFSRKGRQRLNREERNKLIADITGTRHKSPEIEEKVAPPAPPIAKPIAPAPEPVSVQVAEPVPEPVQKPAATHAAAPMPFPIEAPIPSEPMYMAANIPPAPEPIAAPEPTPEPMQVIAPEPAQIQVREPIVTAVPTPIPATVATPEPQMAPAYDAASEPKVKAPIDKWDMLDSIPVDAQHLENNLIITASRHDPAHGAFDVLRTRLVRTLLENNWKRVAITSPTRDCGKTFTAVNLAISLSRYESSRTVLMDMDLRNPSVAKVLGAPNPGSMGDFLQGHSSTENHLKKLGRNTLNIGGNLAVGLNDRVEPYASELMQDPIARDVLDQMMDDINPDIVLYDLPPALTFDDVIAFSPHFDGVLMVIGGGETKASQVREVMRRLGEDTPLLGVVLNQAEGEDMRVYNYGYGS